MGSVRIDPYFYMQPTLSFVEELRKPLHVQKPQWFGRTKLQEGEVNVTGAFLINEFPDEEMSSGGIKEGLTISHM